MSSYIQCSVDGCEKRYHGAGLCSMHYQRKKKYGSVHRDVYGKGLTLKEKIELRFSKTSDDECFIWNGAVGTHGYATIGYGGKILLAHRAYYKEVVGELSDNDSIDHRCRNRKCVNPAHLDVVSQSENNKRMLAAKYYEKEIKRLTDFIESLGYDVTTLNTVVE